MSHPVEVDAEIHPNGIVSGLERVTVVEVFGEGAESPNHLSVGQPWSYGDGEVFYHGTTDGFHEDDVCAE